MFSIKKKKLYVDLIVLHIENKFPRKLYMFRKCQHNIFYLFYFIFYFFFELDFDDAKIVSQLSYSR